MPFDITNFDRADIIGKVKDTIFENDIASSLDINTTRNNVKQFYNRFGQNSVFQQDKLAYRINTSNFFDITFNFKPHNSSKVEKLLRNILSSIPSEELKYFVQSITLPSFNVINGNEPTNTAFGYGLLTGHWVRPSANEFTISLLNTEYSLHEHVFYYWMNEVGSHKWEYSERPFTIADIRVAILDTKTNEVLYEYILTGCRPSSVTPPEISHEAKTAYSRDVGFHFKNMYIISKGKMASSVLDDVFDSYIGNKINNRVRNTVGEIGRKFSDNLPILSKK